MAITIGGKEVSKEEFNSFLKEQKRRHEMEELLRNQPTVFDYIYKDSKDPMVKEVIKASKVSDHLSTKIIEQLKETVDELEKEITLKEIKDDEVIDEVNSEHYLRTEDFIHHYRDLVIITPEMFNHSVVDFLARIEMIFMMFPNDETDTLFISERGFYSPYDFTRKIEVGKTYLVTNPERGLNKAPIVYQNTDELFSLFFISTVMDSVTQRPVHLPRRSENIMYHPPCKPKAVKLFKDIMAEVVIAHLPKNYEPSTRERTIRNLTQVYFPNIVLNTNKTSGRSHPLVTQLFSLYDDLLSLVNPKPYQLVNYVFYHGYIVLINFGDLRLVEWELMKTQTILLNKKRQYLDGYIHPCEISFVDIEPVSLSRELIALYVDCVKDEAIMKIKNKMVPI